MMNGSVDRPALAASEAIEEALRSAIDYESGLALIYAEAGRREPADDTAGQSGLLRTVAKTSRPAANRPPFLPGVPRAGASAAHQANVVSLHSVARHRSDQNAQARQILAAIHDLLAGMQHADPARGGVAPEHLPSESVDLVCTALGLAHLTEGICAEALSSGDLRVALIMALELGNELAQALAAALGQRGGSAVSGTSTLPLIEPQRTPARNMTPAEAFTCDTSIWLG
jgi:hypothetical protein